MTLRLYNTLTRQKEDFKPLDASNVRMYVCGPTVYDFAHIGNARPVIVFDVLFRLLRHLYGENHVTYVRNITDVDDKINARALRDFPELPLNEAIRRVTEKTANQFQADVKALGCLEPTAQPRATEHIAGMIEMIQVLLDRKFAYVAQGEEGREALFDVKAMGSEYGKLSRRSLADQQAGARVAVEKHKRNPEDFVLWKESREDEPGWNATFNVSEDNAKELKLNSMTLNIRGRPGWHIECSAMSKSYLGEVFDIHGGGLDLIFPHHENELAQSRCAHGTKKMANFWMHNGFLQVEGQKMSKSLGNFVTISEHLETEKFGQRRWSGLALRFAMLSSHYTQPIDWTVRGLEQAAMELQSFAQTLSNNSAWQYSSFYSALQPNPSPKLLDALSDDLNTPKAISELRAMHSLAKSGDKAASTELLHSCEFLGILRGDRLQAMYPYHVRSGAKLISTGQNRKLDNLQIAFLNDDTAMMEQIKSELNQEGITAKIGDNGSIVYSVASVAAIDDNFIDNLIAARLAARAAKDWKESDRIRDELVGLGVTIKDKKDGTTSWEVKR